MESNDEEHDAGETSDGSDESEISERSEGEEEDDSGVSGGSEQSDGSDDEREEDSEEMKQSGSKANKEEGETDDSKEKDPKETEENDEACEGEEDEDSISISSLSVGEVEPFTFDYTPKSDEYDSSEFSSSSEENWFADSDAEVEVDETTDFLRYLYSYQEDKGLTIEEHEAGPYCSNCLSLLMYAPYIECQDCSAIVCCPCFHFGCEMGDHLKTHRYRIVDGFVRDEVKNRLPASDEKVIIDTAHAFKLGHWNTTVSEEFATDVLTTISPETMSFYFEEYFINGMVGRFAIAEGYWMQYRHVYKKNGTLKKLLDTRDRSNPLLYSLYLAAMRWKKTTDWRPDDDELEEKIIEAAYEYIEYEFKIDGKELLGTPKDTYFFGKDLNLPPPIVVHASLEERKRREAAEWRDAEKVLAHRSVIADNRRRLIRDKRKADESDDEDEKYREELPVLPAYYQNGPWFNPISMLEALDEEGNIIRPEETKKRKAKEPEHHLKVVDKKVDSHNKTRFFITCISKEDVRRHILDTRRKAIEKEAEAYKAAMEKRRAEHERQQTELKELANGEYEEQEEDQEDEQQDDEQIEDEDQEYEEQQYDEQEDEQHDDEQQEDEQREIEVIELSDDDEMDDDVVEVVQDQSNQDQEEVQDEVEYMEVEEVEKEEEKEREEEKKNDKVNGYDNYADADDEEEHEEQEQEVIPIRRASRRMSSRNKRKNSETTQRSRKKSMKNKEARSNTCEPSTSKTRYNTRSTSESKCKSESSGSRQQTPFEDSSDDEAYKTPSEVTPIKVLIGDDDGVMTDDGQPPVRRISRRNTSELAEEKEGQQQPATEERTKPRICLRIKKSLIRKPPTPVPEGSELDEDEETYESSREYNTDEEQQRRSVEEPKEPAAESEEVVHKRCKRRNTERANKDPSEKKQRKKKKKKKAPKPKKLRRLEAFLKREKKKMQQYEKEVEVEPPQPEIISMKELAEVRCYFKNLSLFICESTFAERPIIKVEDSKSLAYNTYRNEFEMESYNDAESIISELAVGINTQIASAANLSQFIKVARVLRYNRAVKARITRRNAIVEHDLINRVIDSLKLMTLERRTFPQVMEARLKDENLVDRGRQSLTRDECKLVETKWDQYQELKEKIIILQKLQGNGVTSMKGVDLTTKRTKYKLSTKKSAETLKKADAKFRVIQKQFMQMYALEDY